MTLAACGGGESGRQASSRGADAAQSGASESGAPADGPVTAAWSGHSGSIEDLLTAPEPGADAGVPKAATTQSDAVRLAHQASFGPSESLVSQILAEGAERWVTAQMGLRRQAVKLVPGGPPQVIVVQLPPSKYTSGGTNAVHKHTSQTVDFCDGKGDNCWRDWSSSTPLAWDFYRNAVHGPDQLRQRVGLALQQLVVISNEEVSGTYGLRNYHNMLLDNAFGNYRTILRKVILSPVMGDYLTHVNNDKDAPNENFARELLQLFSIGTCELNLDGSLKGGACAPTYNNDVVREYAFALTGWTYPKGGASPWGCWPSGANCRFYDGDMVSVSSFHNTGKRTLLSGVSLSQGNTAATALDAVLNSVMNHPNVGPFVGRHLIQQLVTSNPSAAYVQRVATAFNSGTYAGTLGTFGNGTKGDLAATVAAVLLDSEARTTSPGNNAGRLREPIQHFTGVLRALNGKTDGDALGWWWGEDLREHVFRSPTVFNFYPPDYPLAGTSLRGPAFGIHNANTALNRINFVHFMVFWDGAEPGTSVPNAVGTQVNLSAFTSSATNAASLVDRLSLLVLGAKLPTTPRNAVIAAVEAYPSNTADGRLDRVRQAAFLVLASPQYQVIR